MAAGDFPSNFELTEKFRKLAREIRPDKVWFGLSNAADAIEHAPWAITYEDLPTMTPTPAPNHRLKFVKRGIINMLKEHFMAKVGGQDQGLCAARAIELGRATASQEEPIEDPDEAAEAAS